jgi:hypothetical protein
MHGLTISHVVDQVARMVERRAYILSRMLSHIPGTTYNYDRIGLMLQDALLPSVEEQVDSRVIAYIILPHLARSKSQWTRWLIRRYSNSLPATTEHYEAGIDALKRIQNKSAILLTILLSIGFEAATSEDVAVAVNQLQLWCSFLTSSRVRPIVV